MIASNRFALMRDAAVQNFRILGHVPLAAQDRNFTLMLVHPKGTPKDGNWSMAEAMATHPGVRFL